MILRLLGTVPGRSVLHCWAFAAAASLLLASAGKAQDEAEEAADAAEEAAAEAAFDVNMIQISEQQLAGWVFGNRMELRGGAAQTRRGMVAEALAAEIDLVQAAVPLSDPQRRKLELAGRGDVERFMDRYEAFAARCPNRPIPQDKYLELHQEAQPLAARYRAGLHGDGSLFRKVLRSTLDAEQLARFDALQAERNRKRYEAVVRATVVMIDQKVPLTADQRDRLTEVTLRETAPPDVAVEGSYKYHVALLQMSKIPQERLKPIFSEEEWVAMRALLAQGRVAEGMLRRAAQADLEE